MYVTAAIAFIWGTLACSTMAYYTALWITQSENPLRHELGLGFGMGLVFGIPAWVGIPVAIYIGRKLLPRPYLVALSLPMVVATLSTVILCVAEGL